MAINRDKILKSAEKLVQKGKIEQAIREYEKLLKLNANDVNTINRVGDLYNRIGQVDKAVELYERIAETFATDGFTNKAIAILKKINRLAPDRVDIFKRLAELYLQQGLIFEAKSKYQALADWYLKNDDLDGGIEIHRKLVEIDSGNHVAQLRLADLLLRKGEGTEGVEVYDRLGRMLLEAGKTEEAERLYRHALEQDPPEGEFVAPMCEALIDSGNIATAQEFYTTAQKISPESDRLKVIGLRLSLSTGESARALEMSRQLLESHGEDAKIAILAGRALLAGGEGVEGRDILIPQADRALTGGNVAQAREIFSSLIKVLPQDQQVLELGTKVLSRETDGEMLFAIKAALADLHFRGGRKDAARRLYEELHTCEPDNKLVLQRLEALGSAPARQESTPAKAAAAAPVEEEPEEIEIIDFESDPEIIEFELPGEEIEFPDFDGVVGEVPAAEAAPAPREDVGFDPAERIAEASVFAKYGLFDKAIDHLKQVVTAFPDEYKARERLVLLAVETGQTETALSFAGPLEKYYLDEGLDDALDALYRSLPELRQESAVPAAAGVAAEEIEVPEVIEVEAPVAEAAVPEAAPAPLQTVISDEVEEIEMEEVAVEEVDMEALRPDQGLDFEVLDASDFQGAPEKEALLYAPSPEPAPTPKPEEVLEPVAPEADGEAVAPPPAPEPGPAKPKTPPGGIDILGELAELEQSIRTPQPTQRPQAPQSPVGVAGLDDLFQTPPASKPPAAVPVEAPAAVEAPGPVQVQPPAAEAAVMEAEGPVETVWDGPAPAREDLEQMQSFLEHSLYEDATRIFTRLESEFPEHPDVVETRRLLKSKGLLIEDVPQAEEDAEDLFADEADEYVDLAAELEEEMAAEEALVSEAAGARESEADLEDVFREFQKGVAEQLSEEDADTHFNLGIAYKEMGLLPEAIREFQIASRSDDFFVEGCSMIGICYSEQGMWEQAASWYSKVLGAPGLSTRSTLALKYDLANALEASGDQGGALEIFQDILSMDPSFRDTRQRLGHLSGQAQAN